MSFKFIGTQFSGQLTVGSRQSGGNESEVEHLPLTINHSPSLLYAL